MPRLALRPGLFQHPATGHGRTGTWHEVKRRRSSSTPCVCLICPSEGIAGKLRRRPPAKRVWPSFGFVHGPSPKDEAGDGSGSDPWESAVGLRKATVSGRARAPSQPESKIRGQGIHTTSHQSSRRSRRLIRKLCPRATSAHPYIRPYARTHGRPTVAGAES
ncbi:hypothetical protein N657DRAFT_225811 [Parathielavia appendiculata]|uniref:Uncharacterized protein n=1 Tax=Parathielavia appendiculata TaxID=2587402 RepID=A0AAN6U780_9PEZI|nr:hypothetical protein N657DRAFT_225811 [Parathielavia appendiculata]